MQQLAKPVILLVDDSDITRASLTKIFNEYNCEIISCPDGMAGIQKALVSKPDLIILDILMPNLDGIKMLQIIKLIEELKDIPVIVLSGNINKSNLLAAMEAGADKVINKPFNVTDLISATNELLKNPLEKNHLTGISLLQKSGSGDEDLKNIFVEKFPTQKKNIIRYVTTRDKNRLKNIFHQLKGVGTTVGFPQVTALCTELENLVMADVVDWNNITKQCEKIFSTVSLTRLQNSVGN
jgi:CheY-like chemotaxis protein/HPt (histidine-containing phosphotransfer) domain-containing protein